MTNDADDEDGLVGLSLSYDSWERITIRGKILVNFRTIYTSLIVKPKRQKRLTVVSLEGFVWSKLFDGLLLSFRWLLLAQDKDNNAILAYI